MPATAGRVRMPPNNRVHSSAALHTHSIWENTIKYNPYAPKKDDSNSDFDSKTTGNTYEDFQDLIKRARISVSNPDDESRGACKRCGLLGHLSFQCGNFLTAKEKEQKVPIMKQKPLLSSLEKTKEESEREESETCDSEVDSEIERIIAQRYGNGNGKKKCIKRRSSSRKKDVSDDSDSDSRGRKRGKSKKRRSQKKRGRSDSESEDEAKRKSRKKR